MSSIEGLLPLLAMVQGSIGGGGAGAGASPDMGGLMGLANARAALGQSSIPGSGPLFGVGAGMGGAQLPGTPAVPSGMPSQFSMPAGVGPSAMSPMMMQAALSMMQQGNPQQQQSGQAAPMPQQVAFGNAPVRGPSISQPMPYLTAGGAQPFGFGGVPYV